MTTTTHQKIGILGIAALAGIALGLGTAGAVRAGTHHAPDSPTAQARAVAVPVTAATPGPAEATLPDGTTAHPHNNSATPDVPLPVAVPPANANSVDLGNASPIPLPKQIPDVIGPTINLLNVACQDHIVADLAVTDPATVAKVSIHWTGVGPNQQPIGKWIGWVKKKGGLYEATVYSGATASNSLIVTAIDGKGNVANRSFDNLCN